jgi:hypothetical protein
VREISPTLLILDEYGVVFEYLPGKKQKNVGTVVDALSRLDRKQQHHSLKI